MHCFFYNFQPSPTGGIVRPVPSAFDLVSGDLRTMFREIHQELEGDIRTEPYLKEALRDAFKRIGDADQADNRCGIAFSCPLI